MRAKSPGRTLQGTWPGVCGGPSGCPPLGLAATAAQWGKGWERGSGLRGGGSESASRAQHMPRFTFWSAVSRGVCEHPAVWTRAFHTGL